MYLIMKLNKTQITIISQLAQTSLQPIFYWTGGTLLSSHYLHHRLSFDLDFFSSTKFGFDQINDFVQSVKALVPFSEVTFHKIYDRYEFICQGKEPIRLDFVWYNHEKKTLKKQLLYHGVFIDSFEDVSANKVIALVDRGEAKDLFDLYYILKKNTFSISSLLSMVKQKFGITIGQDLFWSQCYQIIPKLKIITPYLLDQKKESEIISSIDEFVRSHARSYLKNQLTG